MLVVVSLFAVFSISVSAEVLDAENGTTASFEVYYTDDILEFEQWYPIPSGEMDDGWTVGYVDEAAFLDINYTFELEKPIEAGVGLDILKTVNIKLSKVHLLCYFTKWFYLDKFDNVSLLVTYADGQQLEFEGTYSFSNPEGTFNFDIVAPEDIVKLSFMGRTYLKKNYGVTGAGEFDIEYLVDETTYPELHVTAESEESAILRDSNKEHKKQTGLLRDILSSIGDLGGNISDGFSNMIKGITELPQKLWDLIGEGLKSLFVPSEDDMTAYKDKWDELLSSRFGALYQVGDIMVNSIANIRESDVTNTITFPEATINLAGTEFSFGGYDVKVVPDGFETIVEICKKIISIACTFLFFNGLRKRYDEVMG